MVDGAGAFALTGGCVGDCAFDEMLSLCADPILLLIPIASPNVTPITTDAATIIAASFPTLKVPGFSEPFLGDIPCFESLSGI